MKIKSKVTIERKDYNSESDTIIKNHRSISGALRHIKRGKFGYYGTLYIDGQSHFIDYLTTEDDVRRNLDL